MWPRILSKNLVMFHQGMLIHSARRLSKKSPKDITVSQRRILVRSPHTRHWHWCMTVSFSFSFRMSGSNIYNLGLNPFRYWFYSLHGHRIHQLILLLSISEAAWCLVSVVHSKNMWTQTFEICTKPRREIRVLIREPSPMSDPMVHPIIVRLPFIHGV